MKAQEEAIYREIQRNAENAITTIETVWDKVYDTDLSMQISRQSLTYGQLRSAAMQALLDENVTPYRGSQLADMKLKVGIHYNTLLNTSTGRIAELMIRERSEGQVQLEKVLKHNMGAGEKPLTLAKEFIDFQKKSIRALEDYL